MKTHSNATDLPAETVGPARGLRSLARLPWHQIIPLAIGLYCAVLLAERLTEVDLAAVWQTARDVTALQWAAALGATGISFWSLGRYDVHMHAHAGTGIAPARAARAGICAIAVSQVTGLAALVAGLVRWKLLRPMGPGAVATLTLSVSVVFLLGWGLTLALSALLPGAPVPALSVPLALAALAAVLGLSIWRPALPGWPRTMAIPSALLVGRLSGLAIVDLCATGLALYVLLPADLHLGFAAFLPVFLLAFGAGLYSGTPGGVGPFELTILAMLPQVPAPDLLAAFLVFRLVYYAIPACLASAVLLRDHLQTDETEPMRSGQPDLAHRPTPVPRRAETGLVPANGGALAWFDDTVWAHVDTGQTLVFLLDPAEGCAGAALPRVRHKARARGRLALLYKLSGRSAALVAARGWTTLRLNDEAWLRPAMFDLSSPAYRQLRRKLRQADKAGIVIRPLDLSRDYAEMARVAQAWRADHGRERGISMGRFSSAALSGQQIFGATRDGALIAFVSFHATRTEWCLDLMRHVSDVPDGTMHRLVVAGLDAARTSGVGIVSLAAAPAPADAARSALHRWLLQRSAGLRRFKASFAPVWCPRYVAAPGPLHLSLALLDMARAVHFPDRIAHVTEDPSSSM